MDRANLRGSELLKDCLEDIIKIAGDARCVWEFIEKRNCRTMFKQQIPDALHMKVASSVIKRRKEGLLVIPAMMLRECPGLKRYVKKGVLFVEDVDAALMKTFLFIVTLRWFIRLNVGMCLLDNVRYAALLKHFFISLVKISLDPEVSYALPTVLDFFIDTLRHKFGSSWFEFLDFIYSCSVPERHVNSVSGLSQRGRSTSATSSASISRNMVDEITINYVVEQSLENAQLEEFLKLFDRFELAKPQFNHEATEFNTLIEWSQEVGIRRERLSKGAIRQAHEWVAVLECGRVKETEESVMIISHILSHPQRFSRAFRDRLIELLHALEWSESTMKKVEIWRTSNWGLPVIPPYQICAITNLVGEKAYKDAELQFRKVSTKNMGPIGFKSPSKNTASRYMGERGPLNDMLRDKYERDEKRPMED